MLLLVLGSLGPKWPEPMATPFLVVGVLLFVGGMSQLALGLYAVGPSLGISPRPTQGSSLRTAGLLGRVRHPVYGGWMLAGIGWALVFSPCSLLPAVLLIVELDLKRRVEERMLVRAYPDYAAYALRVPRIYVVIP